MDTTQTTKTPAMSDTSILAFAQDAADTLQAVCDAEKAPLISGYVLVAFTNKGDTSRLYINGKSSHITDSLCSIIEQTDYGWQIFNNVMAEMERRINRKRQQSNNPKN